MITIMTIMWTAQRGMVKIVTNLSSTRFFHFSRAKASTSPIIKQCIIIQYNNVDRAGAAAGGCSAWRSSAQQLGRPRAGLLSSSDNNNNNNNNNDDKHK